MQRSFSASAANYQHFNRSSEKPSRSIPIRLEPSMNTNDNYQSDTDLHQKAHLQRASSSSSFCSSSSTGSANYRILPVRYSSVDRVVEKPAIISANKHGINVRIRFERPHFHSHCSRHHRRHQHDDEHHEHYRTEEYEHYRERQTTKEEQRYGSCPVLDQNSANSKTIAVRRQQPSNINYIETRSIVRGQSSDQLNRKSQPTLVVTAHQSLPASPRVAHTRIKHIPLDTRSMFKPVISRVIKEEEE